MKIDWHTGDVIRKLRESVNIKQKKLAALCGMRPATICAIEKTGKYKPGTLKDIASALKVRDADILLLVPGNSTEAAPIQDENTYTCADADHKKWHELLDQILNGTRPDADYWIQGIQSNLVSMSNSATTPLPNGFKPKGGNRAPASVFGVDRMPAVPHKVGKKAV